MDGERMRNIIAFITCMIAIIAANVNVPATYAMMVRGEVYGSVKVSSARTQEDADEELKETDIEVVDPELTQNTPYASVNGKMLDRHLQDILFEELKARDIEWYFDIALCQLYQESAYISSAISPDGKDCGIAQVRVMYLDEMMKVAGMTECDVFDPEDSIRLYAGIMARNIEACDSIEESVSMYMTGLSTVFNQRYVNQVMSWLNRLERAERKEIVCEDQ